MYQVICKSKLKCFLGINLPFYGSLLSESYKKLKKFARKIITIFGRKYGISAAPTNTHVIYLAILQQKVADPWYTLSKFS